MTVDGGVSAGIHMPSAVDYEGDDSFVDPRMAKKARTGAATP